MVLPDVTNLIHRDQIIALAAAIVCPRSTRIVTMPPSGGLLSYGCESADVFRRAAAYVDRILKGTKSGRTPGAGADQVRAGDQSQDCKGARPRRTADRCSPAPTR